MEHALRYREVQPAGHWPEVQKGGPGETSLWMGGREQRAGNLYASLQTDEATKTVPSLQATANEHHDFQAEAGVRVQG